MTRFILLSLLLTSCGGPAMPEYPEGEYDLYLMMHRNECFFSLPLNMTFRWRFSEQGIETHSAVIKPLERFGFQGIETWYYSYQDETAPEGAFRVGNFVVVSHREDQNWDVLWKNDYSSDWMEGCSVSLKGVMVRSL